MASCPEHMLDKSPTFVMVGQANRSFGSLGRAVVAESLTKAITPVVHIHRMSCQSSYSKRKYIHVGIFEPVSRPIRGLSA